MNIAFASSDGIVIDQHFGWSKRFYLFDVDDTGAELVGTIDSSQEIEDEHAKLSYKIETIGDADIMYCSQIGPKASKMVQAAGIHPVRIADGEKIESAIKQIQAMLNDNPPMWLLRIFHKAKARAH
jgi:nitrogen fixation protein NifX